MYHRKALSLLLALLLTACGNQPVEREELVSQYPPPVGAVELQRQAQPQSWQRLDIGLVVFDPGLPEDESTYSRLAIFPEIRNAEARYLAVTLRQVLQETEAWGVIRVLPDPDPAAELLVEAQILHSDGLQLVLQVNAVDASGRQWLDRIYVDETEAADYPVAPGDDPYLDLYRQIANDLLLARQGLDTASLRRLRDISMLRYAASLSPQAFGGHLQQDAQGRYQLLRLPAADDPMVARVQRIRNQEFQFIDHIDEQYLQLRQEMANTYNLWRQYSREQALYQDIYQQRVDERDRAGPRGSFLALQQAYNAYKWNKIQQQDLTELAGGFGNEVAPTIISVGDQVYQLGGTLSAQYTEWRDILQQIFALETGL